MHWKSEAHFACSARQPCFHFLESRLLLSIVEYDKSLIITLLFLALQGPILSNVMIKNMESRENIVPV